MGKKIFITILLYIIQIGLYSIAFGLMIPTIGFFKRMFIFTLIVIGTKVIELKECSS